MRSFGRVAGLLVVALAVLGAAAPAWAHERPPKRVLILVSGATSWSRPTCAR